MTGRELSDWIRPIGTIQGTGITLYESLGPLPGVVWMVPHDIASGPTRALALQDRNTLVSRNTVAGEPGMPLTPGMEGLGAEGWEARQKREMEEFERAQRTAIKKQSFGGVRGYRISVMGPQTEARVSGKDQRTLSRFNTIYYRLPLATAHHGGTRAWLESHKGMASNDPMRSVGGKRFQPWVNESCVPWLVIAGSKLGLRFAVPPYDAADLEKQPSRYEESPATGLMKLVASYVRDPQNFANVFGACSLVPERDKGVIRSSDVLGLKKREGPGVDAETLYNHYRWALKNHSDSAEVHAAYHRVLLHKFLRRRPLVPGSGRANSVANAAERRARLLQARRILVFNSAGCPVAFNQPVLEENGISFPAGRKEVHNATLVFKSRADAALVDDWTRWLYEHVLELPMAQCTRVLGEQIADLAGAGHLA